MSMKGNKTPQWAKRGQKKAVIMCSLLIAGKCSSKCVCSPATRAPEASSAHS
uniref:Uncharacterized protein n=1 Tax=Anguilla anguilla TaxID=7936 RepID=A0A0E9Q7V8_ANGAN